MENPSSQNFDAPRSGGRKLYAAIIILLLIGGSFRLGLTLGKKGYVYAPKEFKIINQANSPATVDYGLLWDAIKTVNDNYIEKPLDQQKVLYGAVRGAVAAGGDQYTQFFDPKDLENFKTDLAGSFEGIGAEIGKQNNNIVIVAPLAGTPAQKAGLKAKDAIVQVNGESTANWSVDEAVSKIRGPGGTKVVLTIFREGRTKTFEVSIIRQKIEIKSVKWEIKEQNGKKIAVITLSRFGDDTKSLFNQAINQTLTSSVSGLVLDLRNDPGGYLEGAVEIASNWVDKGQSVVSEVSSQAQGLQIYKSYGYGRLRGIKTIILINGGSASAAEILAGALHDYGLAQLIGEKSFGKGSVQQLFDLPGKAAVKVTVAKWITPNGKNLNKDGLTPDTEVKLSDEDAAAGRDPQLERALEEALKS